MLFRSESPSPVDEDDPDSDSRVKRLCRTTLTLEHARPKKRKLPSCSQSPTEEEGDDVTDARSLITKRQRYIALEHGFERLSLTPPSYPPVAMPVPAPEFATRLPASGVPPEFGFSSSSPQWVDIPASSPPVFQQISSPTNLVPPTSTRLAGGADVIEDIKMRSSSWYEPEKDRACMCLLSFEPPLTHGYTGIVVTDLDASSDDEQEDGDGAPKLPRAVLQALLRGGPDPAARGDVPRMLLAQAGLLPSPFAPSPPPSLELASLLPEPGSSDEAMDVEQ